jgi:dipeptidyl aminopeptidase/acylaminoacyl peptidase
MGVIMLGFIRSLIGLTVFVMPVAAQAQTAPQTQPRRVSSSDFAQESLLTRPRLSPDGTRLLARTQIKGKEMLLVYTFMGGGLRTFELPEKHDLRTYRWAGNNRILFSVAKTIPWFGDEAEVTRLVSLDLTTNASLVLGKKNGGLEGDDILYVDKSGDWILLSIQKTIYDYPSVYRVELATNTMTEVVKQRHDVWEWYADNDGVVRAGIGIGADLKSWSMVYRKNEGEKFRKLGKARFDDEDAAFDILRFARESDDGFVLRNHETGRYALYKFNYATKQVGEKVFESPTNDITDFDTSDDGTALRAVWFTDERDRVVWYDPILKKIQADIDAAAPRSENWIVSRTPDSSTLLIWTVSSGNPGSYYLYRPAQGVMKRVASVNELLKPSELSRSTYVKYTARDGLSIPAYLTLPVGRPSKGLPLIILPHGGPYGVRDRGDYDPEVQFLVNRGYAVLQPNYRGSDGYGKSFYEKGEGQWGRQMQDDLDDGMDWLARQGTIDPKRVCIVGSSYGGYAAMWGATRNPERYRCAASFAGVSDLGRQLSYQLDFAISRRYRKDWRTTVQGDKSFDPKTVSPLYTIDRLKTPVLIVHGEADQTVPFKQSKLYADALKNAGKTYEFHSYPKEGHGFADNANLKDWLDRLEAFLKQHNPPD